MEQSNNQKLEIPFQNIEDFAVWIKRISISEEEYDFAEIIIFKLKKLIEKDQ